MRGLSRSRAGGLSRSRFGLPGFNRRIGRHRGRHLRGRVLSRRRRRRGGIGPSRAGWLGDLGLGAGRGGSCWRGGGCRRGRSAGRRQPNRNCPGVRDGPAVLTRVCRRRRGRGWRRISRNRLFRAGTAEHRLRKIRCHDIGSAEKGEQEKNPVSRHESERDGSGHACTAQPSSGIVNENRAGCRHSRPLGGTSKSRHNGTHRRRVALRISNQLSAFPPRAGLFIAFSTDFAQAILQARAGLSSPSSKEHLQG
jgi:hypothetical protein